MNRQELFALAASVDGVDATKLERRPWYWSSKEAVSRPGVPYLEYTIRWTEPIKETKNAD